jgi:hypothetical protein
MRSISPTAMKESRRATVACGRSQLALDWAGREKRVKEVPGAGAGPEGVGYDAALLLEHRASRRPRTAAKRQLAVPSVEVCVLPQLYPPAR